MDKKKIAYVFPGQGSQYVGMGKEIFPKYPDIVAIANRVLGYSIEELCVNNPDNKLNNTRYTQPALYTVNALMYEEKIKSDDYIPPDYLAGHSLGEYNALFAAGAFDFETGLKLVKRRAELMSKAHNGAMAAVMGLEIKDIKRILADNNLDEIDLANLNTRYQTIVSGRETDIDLAIDVFEREENVRCVRLNTSGAFHSRYMSEAKKEFIETLKQYSFNELKIPVISNYTGKPYSKDTVTEYLQEQICAPVLWLNSIEYLVENGVDTKNIIQIGPGTVLSDMILKMNYESFLTNKKENMTVPDIDKNKKSATKIVKKNLESQDFKTYLNLKYPYVCNSMYYNIVSPEMIIKLSNSGMLGFLGTSMRSLFEIREDINIIRREVNEATFGLGIVHNKNTKVEDEVFQFLLDEDIKIIEISDYLTVTKNIVKYKLKGINKHNTETETQKHYIMAKVARIETAELFLKPAPTKIIEELIEEGEITTEESICGRNEPIADFISVITENDIHVSSPSNFMLFNEISKLSLEIQEKYGYIRKPFIGIEGGIGNPLAIANAFFIGADYVVTGSINQCSNQARISESVKDILQTLDIHDCESVPDLENMELGVMVNVVRKSTLFPARINKLYDLYRRYNSLDEIDSDILASLESRVFKESIEEFCKDSEKFFDEAELNTMRKSRKGKILQIVKSYYYQALKNAIKGNEERKIDYCIRCNPTMGLFNRWAKGKDIESWVNRDVDVIGMMMLEEARKIIYENSNILLKEK